MTFLASKHSALPDLSQEKISIPLRVQDILWGIENTHVSSYMKSHKNKYHLCFHLIRHVQYIYLKKKEKRKKVHLLWVKTLFLKNIAAECGSRRVSWFHPDITVGVRKMGHQAAHQKTGINIGGARGGLPPMEFADEREIFTEWLLSVGHVI